MTFVALKPGLVLEPGRGLAGSVDVVDIGLPVGRPRVHVVESSDVDRWLPRRDPMAHKWTTACRVIGGGPGMTGAATLAASAAMKTGAGFVQLVRPGVDADAPGPVEAVRIGVPAGSWGRAAIAGHERVAAVLVGPGLGSSAAIGAEAALVVAECDRPIVIDADALGPATVEALSARSSAAIVTPHDGEFARLGGDPSELDRIGATTRLAETIGAIVVRKGPTTIVAAPDGDVRVVTAADQRLATAGTGDVLAGVIVGALARGASPFDAAAGGAHLHAIAAGLGPDEGLTAGALVDLIPPAVASLRAP